MFEWTLENTEVATRLWNDGASATEIANQLEGATRSAVAGKMHRLGLKKGRPGSTVPSQKAVMMGVAARSAKLRRPTVTLAGAPRPAPAKQNRGGIALSQKIRAAQVPVTLASISAAVSEAAPGQGPALQPGLAMEPYTGSPVPLMDRKVRQCCFPLWGDTKPPVEQRMVCGAPVERGAYCGTHGALCYGGYSDIEPLPGNRRVA